MGLQPTTVHEVDDLVGCRSPRRIKASLWSITSAAEVQDNVELGASLNVLLGRLEPVTDRLWELHAEGHTMDWFCFVGSHATEHAVGLDRLLLTRLLALPGHLLLDVYSDGEDGG